MADDRRFGWQCAFTIPWKEPHRSRAQYEIANYLKFTSHTTGVMFEMTEDTDSPNRVWVGAKGPLPTSPINEIVLTVEKDIGNLLANLIGPAPAPKSVYDWLREDPYK